MMDAQQAPRYFALLPAAGLGSRAGGSLPKQYLDIGGKPLIWHTLSTLLNCSWIEQVAIVISSVDQEWNQHECLNALLDLPKAKLLRCGGETRAQSVLQGLIELDGLVDKTDWVLVHDAARPCLTQEMLDNLRTTLLHDEVGGLLAVPVADTIKCTDTTQRVSKTLDRTSLWQAQTPQMFRYGLMLKALQQFAWVSDEAGAIEAAGYAPKLVQGSRANLKVTYHEDLTVAEAILQSQYNEAR